MADHTHVPWIASPAGSEIHDRPERWSPVVDHALYTSHQQRSQSGSHPQQTNLPGQGSSGSSAINGKILQLAPVSRATSTARQRVPAAGNDAFPGHPHYHLAGLVSGILVRGPSPVARFYGNLIGAGPVHLPNSRA